jgi:hypothetical protein
MQVVVRRSIARRGLFRLLYIFNWVFLAHTEPYHMHQYLLVYTAGGIQMLSYCDFLWYYISSYFNVMVGRTVQEPVGMPPNAAVPLLSEEETDAEVALVVRGAPTVAATSESVASPEIRIE